MLRHLGSRSLSVPACLSRKTLSHFPVPFWRQSLTPWDWMDREMDRMDRVFHSPFWSSPFSRHISQLDSSPFPLIINDEGINKFLVHFDVSKFKPEEVQVTTTSSENTLKVEAKHEDDTCNFQFSRVISVPKGTKLSELKCRFLSDGTLTLEAPYEGPPEDKKQVEANETQIPVKHN